MSAIPLWHGRFKDTPDDSAIAFSTSIHEDSRLVFFDIEGSIAHASMLHKIGLINSEELASIQSGLESIKTDLKSGALTIDDSFEDIHSFIEMTLTARIGDAGAKLHTARSRNDQIALDERLYLRSFCTELSTQIVTLIKTLCRISREHLDTIMPGFTHTQHAQPITLAHHLCAYGFMFKRDKERLEDCQKRINICPIGCAAMATSTYKVDRVFEAELMDFPKISENSLDAVSDRDHFLELASALSIIQMHLSRACEELVLWQTSEFAFVRLEDRYSTGSSIMPQKKNPDFAELIRGKTGQVFASLTGLFVMMKGLPLSYNRDLQEDKAPLFKACDTVKASIDIYTKMIASATFNKDAMLAECEKGFLNATDVAEYLAKKGLPFRHAHEVSASLVTLSESRKVRLEDLSMEDFKSASALFESDIFDALNIKNCVKNRNTPGGPAKESVLKQIQALESI